MIAAAPLAAQERGAAALGELVQHLGVNARVLMIGAHPDDEDTNLITWLRRGRGVETAYLSLTRGDGGQNLIGNELGEALGVIRTEELLAARRIDGAQQYFTRAFDFGFSKDTVDTYKHWPRDTILGDVVRVVRSFRPHVIVAVFSGTPRDGHGHHQVSGLMARAAYDVAMDTVRFPAATHGAAWTPLKLYRSARGNQQAGTLTVDVGEYSPLLGRSFGEIAGESRSLHRSQGFGAAQRKGPIMNSVRREASRVNEATPATSERSMFDAIDTTWARFRGGVSAGTQAQIDSMAAGFVEARRAYDAFAPEKLLSQLARAKRHLMRVCPGAANSCVGAEPATAGTRIRVLNPDLITSLETAFDRLQDAVRVASGVALETQSVGAWALNTDLPVLTRVYNRGRDTVAISGGFVSGMDVGPSRTRLIPPGGMIADTLIGRVLGITQPWWLAGGRVGGMFQRQGSAVADNRRDIYPLVRYTVDLGGRSIGESFPLAGPVENRDIDPVKGELVRRVANVQAVSVTVGEEAQFALANTDIDRDVQVTLQWAAPGDVSERDIRVSLALPRGLLADSATRSVKVSGYFADRSVTFRVRGRLPVGEHRVDVLAESDGETYRTGYATIDYDHISRQRVYRPASIRVSAVDVRVPATLRVAYISGVGDNIAPALTQLGVATTVVAAKDLARANLAGISTIVIGPRAYEANPELAAANPKLFDFARNGGTVLVQYGQYEMTRPGMTPFPITINRPHDRVTLEDAPVTILDASARELTWPNKITDADFADWVQERGLYMPRTFDANYRALFAMNDPGENPIRSGVLVAPLGKGKYIYTSLAFFRQLRAGVPGSARLFVNLLSANLSPTRLTP